MSTILILLVADPSKCEAIVKTPANQIKANNPVLIVCIAKDENGDRFKVGMFFLLTMSISTKSITTYFFLLSASHHESSTHRRLFSLF